MCFASSIVEAHKKLFIAPAQPELNDSTTNVPVSISAAAASTVATSSTARKNTIAKSKKMSRSKSRLQTEVCGDCGASDPSWASINRGILLCSDCCSIHRSLGRHISIVKSLRQGSWEPSVLNFVNSLNAHGANSVWEHHLLDIQSSGSGGGVVGGGSSKNAARIRKPTPKDSLHPTKSDFIRAKHVNLAFVLKPNLHDDDDDSAGGSNLEHELSKQLHASVRTSNLETSLRLLVQGADPNFFHEEKRSTPLHVAAKFGQASQIELLIVYGAELNAIDGNGLTPLEVAKANNHNMIAERLIDALYDVTDRIIMFLGGKKPDHSTGRHLVIPETNIAEISEQLKIARGRLQLVPNKMFEELVMDLYDEVDRRENEAIWSTSTLNAENVAVPFLPANPFLSATRNQGRQKLARFSRAEFAGLLTDVLIDARRRQNMANLRPLESSTSNSFYNPSSTSVLYNSNSGGGGVGVCGIGEHDPNLSDDEPIYDPVASDDDYAPVPPISQQAIVHQSGKPPAVPQESSLEMETLRKQISEYVSEINQLKNVVQKLSSENSELKSKYSNVPPPPPPVPSNSVYDEPLRIELNGSEIDKEPVSLPEGSANNSATFTSAGGGTGSNSSSASSSTNNSNQSTIKRPASMYERRLASNIAKTNTECRTTTSMYQMAAADKPGAFAEEVKQRTDMVTRGLKDLIISMQDATNKEGLVPSAERIHCAVMELVAIFTTPSNYKENIKDTLIQLTRYNVLLQHECENLQNSYCSDDKTATDKCIKEVRDCAYYIASAIKTMVMQFDSFGGSGAK